MSAGDQKNDLDRLFNPRAVAVVGASRDPASLGNRVTAALIRSGFRGSIYPVNPEAEEIHSLRCYESVADLPGLADLAVISLPAPLAEPAARECARKGVKALSVLASGFGEAGRPGQELEDSLTSTVRRLGMRMLGPNCMGLVNTDPEVRLNATFFPASMEPGSVAFLSQSGAMSLAILNHAQRVGLGFRHFVSVGNRADISANDLLEYWRDDGGVRAVLMYIESFGNPERFTRVARSITPKKPIVVVKGGRSAYSSRRALDDLRSASGPSAASNIGGADIAADALFEQCGVLRVDTLDELFDVGRAVTRAPLPARGAVGILSNGAGPGVMAVDAIEARELEVPPLDPRTVSALEKFLPFHLCGRNPVELRPEESPETYTRAMEALLADPNLDTLLVIFVGFEYEGIARAIARGARGSVKPVLACLMGGSDDDPGLGILAEAGIPAYRFPEAAGRVAARLRAYRRYRDRDPGKVKTFRSVDRGAVAACVESARKEGRSDLSLSEIRSVALAYGVKVPREEVVFSEDEAVRAARDIGYPVVVKALSSRVLKKSDLGGVMLDLRNENEVRRAYHSVTEAIRTRYPASSAEGLLVQQMLKSGHELVLSLEHDPIFGRLLMIGAGGPYADIARDFQARIVPITTRDALDMVQSLKIFPLLEGSRGRKPVHIPSLVDMLCRASQLIVEFEEIREFEVNPLMVFPRKKSFWAIDGKMRLFEPGEGPFGASPAGGASRPGR